MLQGGCALRTSWGVQRARLRRAGGLVPPHGSSQGQIQRQQGDGAGPGLREGQGLRDQRGRVWLGRRKGSLPNGCLHNRVNAFDAILMLEMVKVVNVMWCVFYHRLSPFRLL